MTLTYICPRCTCELYAPDVANTVYCEQCNTTYETFLEIEDMWSGSFVYGLTGQSWWGVKEAHQ